MAEPRDGDGAKPFRLEDDARKGQAGTSPPAGAPPPAPSPVPFRVPPPSGIPPPPTGHGEEAPPEVSTLTVRERADPESRTRRGILPPPPGWPAEALRYPWRARGAVFLLGAGAVLVGADLLSRANGFVGAVAKFGVYAWLLRWQARAAAATALGDDRPPRAFEPSDLEPEGLAVFGVLAMRIAIFLVPAGLAVVIPWLKDPHGRPSEGDLDTARWIAFAGIAFLPVVLLGTAVGDRRLTWPWGALPWLVRGAPAVALVLAGWAAQAGVEVLGSRLSGATVGSAAAASFGLRLASTTLLLAGARALGVLGRRLPL